MLKEKVVTDVFDYAKVENSFLHKGICICTASEIVFFTPPLCCQRVASFPITYLLLYIENLQLCNIHSGSTLNSSNY